MTLRRRLYFAAGVLLVIVSLLGVLLLRSVETTGVDQIDQQLRTALPVVISLDHPSRAARPATAVSVASPRQQQSHQRVLCGHDLKEPSNRALQPAQWGWGVSTSPECRHRGGQQGRQNLDSRVSFRVWAVASGAHLISERASRAHRGGVAGSSRRHGQPLAPGRHSGGPHCPRGSHRRRSLGRAIGFAAHRRCDRGGRRNCGWGQDAPSRRARRWDRSGAPSPGLQPHAR